MSKEVTFSIRINDNGTLKKVTADAEELGRVVRSVQDEAESLKRDVLTWSEAAQAVDVLQGTVSELYGVMTDLTSAYQVQKVAEIQLETIMRQRMGATDAEIASIKSLASAQQELGVIGDEVQLSGAQQIATFINEKSSLDMLVPAMNNLLAQQKGLNATNQDAVSIGNMMGKAMQGQTEVLQRVGITFDEAQKSVLQYGTESERAAMLAEVITQNVGNMNAELAKTDAGKQKQLENTLGDIKEQLGSMVQGAMPFMTIASQVTICIAGVGKLVTSMVSLSSALALISLKTKAQSAAALAARTAMRLMGVETTSAGFAVRGTNIALSGTAVALRGVMLATGVGAVITALAYAFDALTSSSDKAAESMETFDEARDAFTRKSGEVKAALDAETKRLKGLMDAKEDTTAAVRHLNEEYGSVFGNHQTAAEWYDVLIKKSKDYAMQLGYEAQAKLIASQIAQKRMQLEDDYDKRRELWKSGKAQTRNKTDDWVDSDGRVHKGTSWSTDSKEYSDLKAQDARLISEIKELEKSLDRAAGKAGEYAGKTAAAAASVTPSPASGAAGSKTKSGTVRTAVAPSPKEAAAAEGSVARLEERVSELRKRLRLTGDTDFAKQIAVELKAAEEELKAKKIEIGLEPVVDISPVEGSIDWLEQRVSDLGHAIGATADDELARQLNAELREAEAALKKKRIDIGLEVAVAEGSAEDKRQRHDQAQRRASALQQDYEIGLTGKDEAIDGLKEINAELERLGMSPVHIDVETEDIEKAREKLRGAADAVGQMGRSLSGLGGSIEMPALDVAGTVAQAVATMTLGYADATAQASKLGPWAWIAFAATGLAELTAVISSVKGMAKFADGGIVYGPTVGLMGEYSGARSNPEVIAPLNKLKSLIGDTGGGGIGRVVGRLKGRDIELVLANETRLSHRRSDIRL